ncbi:MAG: hypothetical protein NTV01_02110 [Bacteroidia bacterium]|nr:hypothetical protein [Bacteroidia bacterium]
MPSILPGYEYDIFISYRQKDNKHDGWVTEFVDNLKGEMEATFKEEISIYFDENPHDGLLETHNVGKSLETKLKCLIFIPIISQTYCDSKSFAWQNEFCVFNKSAGEDQFGIDIKLTSGNVASRILPVKIHNLDPEDKALLENELGGVLRCIEFIYRSAGVNRPLRANEDHPQDNLNKTYYREQVNKVANAVKEIITGIKRFDQQGGEVSKEEIKVRSQKPKNRKAGIAIGSFLLVALLVLGYFFIPKLFKSSDPIEKSIAVLPFENWNSEEQFQHLGDAIANEINTQISLINKFHVISYTSSSRFKGSEKLSMPKIGKELGANFIIAGSIERQDDDISIHARLIEAENDHQIWVKEFKGSWKDIFTIRAKIAKKVAEVLNTSLTPQEVEQIEKTPTDNLEAYNLFLSGRYFLNQNFEESLREGIKCFEQAIKLDPEYAMAYVGLAQCYQFLVRYSGMSNEEGYPKAKKAVLKAIELDGSLGEAYATLGLIKIVFDRDLYGPEQEFQKAIKLSPNNAAVYSSYAQYLRWLGRYDEGIIMAKKAAELDPLTPLTNLWLGAIYFFAGRYDESIDYFKKRVVLDSNYAQNYCFLAYNYVLKGSYSDAIYYANKALSFEEIRKSQLILSPLGWVYAKAGEITKAKEILTEYKELCLNISCDPLNEAIIYVGMGEQDKAFDLLFKACEVRSGLTIYMKVNADCLFKDISSDPRYAELLKRVGFKVN